MFLDLLKDLFTGDANWVRFNVTWTQNGTIIKEDVLYGLYEGYEIGTTPGNKDDMGFHFDMWFNKMNASTVVGGRINCEWFGMSNEAPGWQVWTSKWKPMIQEVTDSKCIVNLVDSSIHPQIHSAKEVTLVKSWVRVWRNNESTFHYMVDNVKTDFRLAKETMIGIDAPMVMETQVPITAQGFFGSRLASAFKNMLTTFVENLLMGGMYMWTYFVGFIDILFGYFGYPQWFSRVTSAINISWEHIPQYIEWTADMVLSMFTLFTSVIGTILFWLTRTVNTFISIINIVVAILNGTQAGLSGLVDVWALLDIDSWIDVIPLFMIVGWFLSLDDRWRKAGRTRWMEFFMNDLKTIMAVIAFMFDIMITLIDLIISFIFKIIDSIPGIG